MPDYLRTEADTIVQINPVGPIDVV